MTSAPFPVFRGSVRILLVITLVQGCKGQSGSTGESSEAKHIRNVADLCAKYTKATKKQPVQIDEVKEWAVKEVKATDQDFLSTRDGEPYGLSSSPTGVIVFEQTGKDAKRYLYIKGGVVEKATDELDQMLANFKETQKHMGGK